MKKTILFFALLLCLLLTACSSTDALFAAAMDAASDTANSSSTAPSFMSSPLAADFQRDLESYVKNRYDEADAVSVTVTDMEKLSKSEYRVQAHATIEYYTYTMERWLDTEYYYNKTNDTWDRQSYGYGSSAFTDEIVYDLSPIVGTWVGSDGCHYGNPFYVEILATEPLTLEGETYSDGSITIRHTILDNYTEEDRAIVTFGDGEAALIMQSRGITATYPMGGNMFHNQFSIVIEEGRILFDNGAVGRQYLRRAD